MVFIIYSSEEAAFKKEKRKIEFEREKRKQCMWKGGTR